MIFGKEQELADDDIILKDVYDFIVNSLITHVRDKKMETTRLDIIGTSIV